MTIYQGTCHCGAVQFQIEADITDIYKCDCTICKPRNVLMTTVHQDGFSMLSSWNSVSLYQGNMNIALHYFCRTCGVYPFHKKRSMPDHYAINVECLKEFTPSVIMIRDGAGSGLAGRQAFPMAE